jgi:hypothetical protein
MAQRDRPRVASGIKAILNFHRRCGAPDVKQKSVDLTVARGLSFYLARGDSES